MDSDRRIAHGVPVSTTQPDGLVERMQSGDFDAFEEFFNAYKRPVYATALAIMIALIAGVTGPGPNEDAKLDVEG